MPIEQLSNKSPIAGCEVERPRPGQGPVRGNCSPFETRSTGRGSGTETAYSWRCRIGGAIAPAILMPWLQISIYRLPVNTKALRDLRPAEVRAGGPAKFE